MTTAPAFWDNSPTKPGWRAHLLRPLGAFYASATARRVARPADLHPDIPVICVGNLNAGGTGKTPTTIALLGYLPENTHIVSRGYGGRLDGPVQVDPLKHSAADVGDEPLLLAAFAPVWVAKDRAAGVASAQKAGARAVILDDGFQNPSVAKSANLVVVDAYRGFGNGLCIPAGPLREPVKAGLARADLVLSIGDDAAQKRFHERWGAHIPVPHLTGSLKPLQMGMSWDGLRVLAFAGIGYPEKFFRTLEEQGAIVTRGQALADHQPLSSALLTRLEAEAKRNSAQLVTTEKDAVRLPRVFQPKVLTLPVRLDFDDDTVLKNLLKQVI